MCPFLNKYRDKKIPDFSQLRGRPQTLSTWGFVCDLIITMLTGTLQEKPVFLPSYFAFIRKLKPLPPKFIPTPLPPLNPI